MGDSQLFKARLRNHAAAGGATSPAAVHLVAGSLLALTHSTATTVAPCQGEVLVDGGPYTGTGYFKFAGVNAAGHTVAVHTAATAGRVTLRATFG